MKSHFYVYRVGYSKPTVRHATLESATAESLRLSAQHPGEVFEILQCLGMSQTTTASTFWADGCGPTVNADHSSPPSQAEEIPWIDHDGGKMPCAAGHKIEVMFRDGSRFTLDEPETFRWNHEGIIDDIMKWRPVF